jgi:hypothetical protein
VSSSGLGQDHHLDSYPDTEEDDTDSSDNDHESINTTTIAKQQQQQTVRKPFPTASSSRVSGNSSPLVSPAGSRTFDEHVQKVPQTLNLEHLHDSLRRSLTKGSDNARTPANASPAPIDNAEREKMVYNNKHLIYIEIVLLIFVCLFIDIIEKKYLCKLCRNSSTVPILYVFIQCRS